MRELFAKWVHDKNTSCNKSGVTRVTEVTSLKSIEIERNPTKTGRVTKVTDDPVEEAGPADVTHVTPAIEQGLQPNSNNINHVTSVTLVTLEMIESLSEAELEAWDERAAILEIDAGLSRTEAEQMAMNMILNRYSPYQN